MVNIILSFLILFLNSTFLAQEYRVDKNGNNKVTFISETTLESFEGVSNKIDGYLALESFEKFITSKLYFEVDLNTLDTGIGLRNRHMRENYLETDKYRYAFYEGKLSDIKLIKGDEYFIESDGMMFIHGVNKKIKVAGKLNINDEGWLLSSEFSILLSDYNIEIPKVMFMKLNNKVQVKLSINLKKL